MSDVNALDGTAPGGNEGSAFSFAEVAARDGLGVAFDLFRRLAINVSWQLMQNMPCEVLA